LDRGAVRATRRDTSRARSSRGVSRGRRYATQQINHAYLVMLSGQFQGFCRDLHSEAADVIAAAITPRSLQPVLRARLTEGRKLDSGNPTPGNLGSDFGRFGMDFWPEVNALHRWNSRRQAHLELVNNWRNAIAHQDFDPARVGGMKTLWLAHVNGWRRICDTLAVMFDRAVADHIARITGTRPW
jgi:hypothetical protein